MAWCGIGSDWMTVMEVGRDWLSWSTSAHLGFIGPCPQILFVHVGLDFGMRE